MNANFEQQRIELELEKLRLENEKLKLEQDQLKSEKSFFKTWIIPFVTPLSLLVTVVIALLTWNNNMVLQTQQTQTDFELRVADVIMNAQTPELAVNRARAVLALFPERLSPTFSELLVNLDPTTYVTGPTLDYMMQERRLTIEGRLELLRLLSAHAEDASLDTLSLWIKSMSQFDGMLFDKAPFSVVDIKAGVDTYMDIIAGRLSGSDPATEVEPYSPESISTFEAQP